MLNFATVISKITWISNIYYISYLCLAVFNLCWNMNFNRESGSSLVLWLFVNWSSRGSNSLSISPSLHKKFWYAFQGNINKLKILFPNILLFQNFLQTKNNISTSCLSHNKCIIFFLYLMCHSHLFISSIYVLRMSLILAILKE